MEGRRCAHINQLAFETRIFTPVLCPASPPPRPCFTCPCIPQFLYYPAEVSALDFQLPGAAKTLSACARLASALEVPQLLEVLDARMEAAGEWGSSCAGGWLRGRAGGWLQPTRRLWVHG